MGNRLKRSVAMLLYRAFNPPKEINIRFSISFGIEDHPSNILNHDISYNCILPYTKCQTILKR